MNRKFLTHGLIATMIATLFSFNAHAGKDDAGAIVGAIVGGLLGNQVGGGNGKIVATGIGIILGAVVGKEIGEQMDNNDRRALAEAQRNCFQQPIGYQTYWDGNSYGSRTGSRGQFRTTREGYYRNTRQVCREYESVIVTRQRTETRTGVACSRSDGSWTEVNSTEVVFHNSGYGQYNNGYGQYNGGYNGGYYDNRNGGYNRPQPLPRPRPGYNHGRRW